MRKTLAVTLLSISLTGAMPLGAADGIRHPAGSYYLGEFPRVLTSLSDLPAPLSEQVEAHLRRRLGLEFYRELRFGGGRAADPADNRWQDQAAKGACAYELFFELTRPGAGLASYMALLSLKRDGSILHEIDLPAVARAPEKIKIIALDRARDIARRHGFSGPGITEEINYDPGRDVLCWRFSRTGEFGAQGLHIRVFEILAHDVNAVREFDTYAIP